MFCMAEVDIPYRKNITSLIIIYMKNVSVHILYYSGVRAWEEGLQPQLRRSQLLKHIIWQIQVFQSQEKIQFSFS